MIEHETIIVQTLNVQITLYLSDELINENPVRDITLTQFPKPSNQAWLRHTEANPRSALQSQLCLRNIGHIGPSFCVIRHKRVYLDDYSTILRKQQQNLGSPESSD